MMNREITNACHFHKFKNHSRIQFIEYGVHEVQKKSLFATIFTETDDKVS